MMQAKGNSSADRLISATQTLCGVVALLMLYAFPAQMLDAMIRYVAGKDFAPKLDFNAPLTK